MQNTKHTYTIKGDEEEWIQGAIIAVGGKSIDIYWRNTKSLELDSITLQVTGDEDKITAFRLPSRLSLIFEIECLPGKGQSEEILLRVKDFPRDHVF